MHPAKLLNGLKFHFLAAFDFCLLGNLMENSGILLFQGSENAGNKLNRDYKVKKTTLIQVAFLHSCIGHNLHTIKTTHSPITVPL